MNLQSEFQALQQEHQKTPYSSFEDRKKILSKIKKTLQNHAYDLAEAINRDFTHRAEEETLFLEIFTTIKAIDYCLHHVKRWMKKRKRNVSWMLMPASAYLMPQPLGVVGIIVPWNYPIYLALVPAVYALAAGNRVMIKMSELSSHAGQILQELLRTIGLDSHVKVINGDLEVSKEFAQLPFGHLVFTGSTAVGKLVMRAASENLTPVTLELGGKSPAVLSKTMNATYFKRLFMGKLYNAAQTCIAPDYLLVPKGWDSIVEEEFKNFIHYHYPELMSNHFYSSIISEPHRNRLLALLDDARSKGARIVEFGELDFKKNKLPVYLIFNATLEMKVMQEEIFGPLLPIITYNTFDEAIEFINHLPNPLALYYFGEEDKEKNAMLTQTLSGALTINDTIMHIAVDDLPFGGVGSSGMGHYHGREGFDTFSKLKPVMVQRRISPTTLLYPPYGGLMKSLLFWIGGIKPRVKK